MHKFFAKTRAIGKKIISLPECHSTNDFVIALSRQKTIAHGTVVLTRNQTKGRGQRGNTWESEPGKNLLLSIFFNRDLPVLQELYLLNIIASLAITEALHPWLEKRHFLSVKWPNDVYLNEKKFVGILIESSVLKQQLEWVVLGMGININQTVFNYAKATSLASHGISVEENEFLEALLLALETGLQRLKQGRREEILKDYYDQLLWLNEERTFESGQLGVFTGIIRGIDTQGRLEIERENDRLTFDVKEVKFIK